jgi:hypothetical protein
MFDREQILETRDPKGRALDELVAPHLDGFGCVSRGDHHQERVVTNTVPFLCHLKQPVDRDRLKHSPRRECRLDMPGPLEGADGGSGQVDARHFLGRVHNLDKRAN